MTYPLSPYWNNGKEGMPHASVYSSLCPFFYIYMSYPRKIQSYGSSHFQQLLSEPRVSQQLQAIWSCFKSSEAASSNLKLMKPSEAASSHLKLMKPSEAASSHLKLMKPSEAASSHLKLLQVIWSCFKPSEAASSHLKLMKPSEAASSHLKPYLEQNMWLYYCWILD